MSTSCNCTPFYPTPPPPPPHHNHGAHNITSCVKPVVGGFTDELKDKLEGIEENANNYVLPSASAEQLGGVKVGEGLSISDDGVISVNPATVVESIPLGDSFTVSENGALELNSETVMQSLPLNDSLVIAEDGTLGVNTEQFIKVDDLEVLFQLDGGSASG